MKPYIIKFKPYSLINGYWALSGEPCQIPRRFNKSRRTAAVQHGSTSRCKQHTVTHNKTSRQALTVDSHAFNHCAGEHPCTGTRSMLHARSPCHVCLPSCSMFIQDHPANSLREEATNLWFAQPVTSAGASAMSTRPPVDIQTTTESGARIGRLPYIVFQREDMFLFSLDIRS